MDKLGIPLLIWCGAIVFANAQFNHFGQQNAFHGLGGHEAKSYNIFHQGSSSKIQPSQNGFGFSHGFQNNFDSFFTPSGPSFGHQPQGGFQAQPQTGFQAQPQGGFQAQPQGGFQAQPQAQGFFKDQFSPAVSFPGDVFGPLTPRPPPMCPAPVTGPCNNAKYRTFDGSCNNLRNPGWGMSMTTYGRLLAPKYGDGVRTPPVAVSGKDLPGSRIVSAILFPDADLPDPIFSLAAMQYGQIITHDMSMAVGTTQAKPHATKCCSSNGLEVKPQESRDATCYPIVIPLDDPVYSKTGQHCMNFVRSTTDIDQGCNPGFKPAEQLVAVTHYLDLSNVYGPNQQMADALREFQGGRLLTEHRQGRPYPPPAANKSAACDQVEETEPCYQTGDARANQNPQLTIFQIILLREHNRVAITLEKINPHWSDETIFQEARRICIAEHQHITYYEWLPIFLGWENSRRHGLIYDTPHYTGDYNANVDPSVLNGHATAAFRYFHTNIQGFLHLINEHRTGFNSLRLSDHFNRPQIIEHGDNFDELIRGMATQSQQTTDQFFTSEITKFLFRNNQPLGQDLRAIDIQRNRDHGLASYNDYRQFCGLQKARTFEEFADLISGENIQRLASLYEHPDDVDFTVGGSLEAHVQGALAGPTFLCVLTEQFFRTRVADRYFYENGEPHQSFTQEQLAEIRKASISRFFCDNGDNIFAMQPRGFLKISPKNVVQPCSAYDAIPIVNLELWRDLPAQNFEHFIK